MENNELPLLDFKLNGVLVKNGLSRKRSKGEVCKKVIVQIQVGGYWPGLELWWWRWREVSNSRYILKAEK